MLESWPSVENLREFQQMPHSWLEAKAKERKIEGIVGVKNMQVPTHLGTFGVSASPFGVCSTFFPGWGEFDVIDRMSKYGFSFDSLGTQRAIEAGLELMGYLVGEVKIFEVPLDLSYLTPFQQDVYSALCTVPYGETITYGELATLAGHPKKARACGTVMRANPMPIFVPCHRVVPASGGLGGWSGPKGWKKELLSLEGVNY